MYMIHFCNHFMSLLLVYYPEKYNSCNFDAVKRLNQSFFRHSVSSKLKDIIAHFFISELVKKWIYLIKGFIKDVSYSLSNSSFILAYKFTSSCCLFFFLV